MNNVRDLHKFKWGKIGPSYLLNENGDLYVLLHNKSVHIVLLNLKEN